MSLKISFSGSALFRSSAFILPYCKKSIIASLVTYLFRNSTSSQAAGRGVFSTTLSGHVDNMQWDTVAFVESSFKKMLWHGKNSSAGNDFRSEQLLNSRPAINSYHSRSVHSCVSYSENKHTSKVYDVDEI